jgi:uncharacterized membrane protein
LDDSAPNPRPAPKRRWSIIAAGLLLLALAGVVIYTSRAAFSSPLALVVVAAIGIVALMLQLRIGKSAGSQVRAPLAINILGLMFAVAAVLADIVHLSASFMVIAALGSVVCFAISGIAVVRALRNKTDPRA